MAAERPLSLVSVVLETDSVHGYDDITLEDCLRALARQWRSTRRPCLSAWWAP